jgi:hypothetical protein
MDKIKHSLCYAHHILPDETARIYGTLGEYLKFVQSPAGNDFTVTHTMLERVTDYYIIVVYTRLKAYDVSFMKVNLFILLIRAKNR